MRAELSATEQPLNFISTWDYPVEGKGAQHPAVASGSRMSEPQNKRSSFQKQEAHTVCTVKHKFWLKAPTYLHTPFMQWCRRPGGHPSRFSIHHTTTHRGSPLPLCFLCFDFMKWSQRQCHTFLQSATSMNNDVANSIQELLTICQFYFYCSYLVKNRTNEHCSSWCQINITEGIHVSCR